MNNLITSLTSSGTTATAVSAAHNLVTGTSVTVMGAANAAYNGTFEITVTGANTFTYALASTATSPDTGAPYWVSISASATARDVIYRAYELCLAVDNYTISAEQASSGLAQLNWLLKSLQSDGAPNYRTDSYTVTIPANTPTIQLPFQVIDIQEARWQSSATYERQMQRYEWGEYVVLPNKQASSSSGPVVFYFNKARDFSSLTIWPVQSVATTINYTAARIIDDINGLNDTLDIPQEWTEAITYQLASRIALTIGLVLSAPTQAQAIEARAEALYSKVRDMERPESVFFKSQRQ